MFTEIRIYYEGSRQLKPGFTKFFAELIGEARERRCPIRLISADGGSDACRDFGIALRTNPDAWNILLMDSEGPQESMFSTSLCRRYNWDQSCADSIFCMVEMMESWFHADKTALEDFYGKGFRRNALKSNPQVESIPKADIQNGLHAATRNTRAGDYFENKTSHGSKLLELIDPKLVRAAAPNCRRLFENVFGRLAEFLRT